MEYLYAVQRETGHEVVSAKVTTDRVSSVTAVVEGDVVRLEQEGVGVLATSDRGLFEPGEQLLLLRWEAENKLKKPVIHKIN